MISDETECRFWMKVKSGCGCWMWMATKNPKGYGRIVVNNRLESAHRVSWRLHFGEIPDGICVCHRCDNPSCVRPDHLFLGTNNENVADKVAKGRSRCSVGSLNPRAVLTEADVIAIRSEYDAAPLIHGIKPRRINTNLAKRYGVSVGQIEKVVYRKFWRHI